MTEWECGKEEMMQCKKNSNAGKNDKWRRQCICLRHSWREVCYRICRMSDWLNGKRR